MQDIKAKQLKDSQSKEERKLALIENQKVKEKAFKLSVKIISWESGSLGSTVVQSVDRISPKEWEQYKRTRSTVIAAIDRNKVKSDLEKTYNSIKENGGFE